MTSPSVPQEQVTGSEQPKVLHIGIYAPEWIILILAWSEGFHLQRPQTSKPVLTKRLWEPSCLLVFSDGIQHGRRTPSRGLLFSIVSYSWEEKGFMRDERKNLVLLYFFLLSLLGILPMQAAFHIVFSSSPLGKRLLFFIKRKDVVAHRPRGETGCLCCLCCICLWVL